MVTSVQGINSMYGAGAMQAPQPLTADQKKLVQSILSQYDPTKLSASDAKSIFQSLKDNGIRPNSEVRDMMKTAGYDTQQLGALAGVGGHHHGHHHAGGASETSAASSSSTSLNASALQSLQSILNQYDLTNLSQDQGTDLMTKLGEAGLTQAGSTINLSA